MGHMTADEFLAYMHKNFGCGKLNSFEDIIEYVAIGNQMGDEILDFKDFAEEEYSKLLHENYELRKRLGE